jgi:hypothetical protein
MRGRGGRGAEGFAERRAIEDLEENLRGDAALVDFIEQRIEATRVEIQVHADVGDEVGERRFARGPSRMRKSWMTHWGMPRNSSARYWRSSTAPARGARGRCA